MRSSPLRRVLCLAAAVAAVAVVATPPSDASGASPPETIGVFRGAVGISAVQEWESWLGSPAHRVLDYLARESWQKIESPDWWVRGWAASPYRHRVVYSVPMLPDTPSTLAAGARGEYDAHFERLARLLIAHGQGGATIRLGWEFNGDWYRWNAAVNPDAFVAYWRRVVTAMRRQPGAAFRFDWCPNLGRGTVAPDRAYPGDAYVDFVGADVYDHSWTSARPDPWLRWNELMEQPYGLRWHRDFARAHGKPMSFPEWGVVASANGGGDSPEFIRLMHDWIAANDVAYTIYFEQDMATASMRLMTGSFPRAAAEFRRLFGPQAPTGPSTPATPPSGGSTPVAGSDGRGSRTSDRGRRARRKAARRKAARRRAARRRAARREAARRRADRRWSGEWPAAERGAPNRGR
jgi:hypothetical protein